ncbi:TrmH family RNA methyltransferase [Mucisphaera sp.]|uniref:TrmH family RNA methyltransferase n=1 Tax=Mucisphaera sp. TaxID=2913024 RepID=UPI003D114116
MPRPITSPTNPLLKRTALLRKPARQRKENVFLAEGHREISRALAAGLKLETLLIDKESHLAQLPTLPADLDIALLPTPLLKKLTYHDQPEGLLAIVERPAWDASLLTTANRILVAVGTAKPGNLGAMARTAAAFGFDLILSAGDTVDPFNPNAIRTSTGAVFSLPILHHTMDELHLWLTQTHHQLLAAEVQASTDYRTLTYTPPLAILIGPEDTGLTPQTLAAIDQANGTRVTIPMKTTSDQTGVGGADSLNASTAAALLMAEATRSPANNA